MKRLLLLLALTLTGPAFGACFTSGATDEVMYFVAVDSTDFTTRETGLTTFTVYRARGDNAAAAMTTPTITEVDATNMPGVYKLDVDEDTTITAGKDREEMSFHITQASMAPVTRTIEICRPKITAGNTLGVETDGDLTQVNTLDGHTPQTGDSFARLGAPAGASHAADIADIPTVAEFNARTLTSASYFDFSTDSVTVGTNNDKTGYALTQAFPTNFASMVISGSGAVDSLLQGFLNSGIAESTADRIAGNFELFWDNADAQTANTVDDVGAGAGGSFWSTGEQNEIRGRLGITGTTAAGGNTPTLALQSAVDDVPTVSEFNARTLASADYFDPAADAVATVTVVGSVSGSVGSISGITFPTNFEDLDIENTTGHVDVGYWNGSEITTALETAQDIVDALLGESCAAPGAGTIEEQLCTDLNTALSNTATLMTRLTAARAGYLDNLNGHTAQTGDSFARLGAPAGASHAADLLTIDNFVDDLESRLTAARAGYLDVLEAEATAFLQCEVNTANFAGDASSFACILTDIDGGAVTQASGDLRGLEFFVTSGDQIRESRFSTSTTWDAGNSELQITVAPGFPATLADAVTIAIR